LGSDQRDKESQLFFENVCANDSPLCTKGIRAGREKNKQIFGWSEYEVARVNGLKGRE
jgi:hypothetical protein